MAQRLIVVAGALGGNLTQEFGALDTLLRFALAPRTRSVDIALVSDHYVVFVVNGNADNAGSSAGDASGRATSTFELSPLGCVVQCGLLPLGSRVPGVSTSGLRWNLGALRCTHDRALSLSVSFSLSLSLCVRASALSQ